MATFPEMIALKQAGPDTYETLRNPEKMGNAANIAYGGCATSAALHAAFLSKPDSFCVYSVQGIFLAPARTDRKFRLTVRRLRDSKSFATRQVDVYQSTGDGPESQSGTDRTVLTMLADFQAPSSSSMLEYTTAPSMTYKGPDSLKSVTELQNSQVEAGAIPAVLPKLYAKLNGLMTRYFQQRPCLEGVGAQNVYGFAKNVQTTQDSLSLPEKRSADWLRHQQPLSSPAEQAAALLFLMDGGSSFIPLTHNHLWFDDTSACSTLEFAFRVFVDKIDMNEDWHLREIGTTNGGAGRTYSESRIWNKDMTMVANMTSQSVLRAKL